MPIRSMELETPCLDHGSALSAFSMSEAASPKLYRLLFFFIGSLLNSAEISEPWDFTGATGLSLSSGNSDNLSYYLQFLATYEDGEREGKFGSDHFRAQSNEEKTTDSLRLFGQYNQILGERSYLGVVGEYFSDEIAEIDYRIELAPVVGYKLIKTDATTLSLSAGPGYSWEQEGGSDNAFGTLRFSQNFKHTFDSGAKCWQNLAFTPKSNDFSDSTLLGEIGFDLRLTDQWALRSTLRHQVNHRTTLSRKKEDSTMLVGFSYQLGGSIKSKTNQRESLKKAPQPKQIAPLGRTTKASTGLSLSRGNAESSGLHFAFDTSVREKHCESFYKLSYAFADHQEKVSENRLTASAQINRTNQENEFFGCGIKFLRDDLADISYRINPALLVGRYLIKSKTLSLSLEAGPSFTIEEISQRNDSYLSAIAAQRFAWMINDDLSLTQELNANFSLEEFKKFNMSANTSLEMAMTADLSWKVGLELLFDHQPALGNVKEDLSLKSALTVRF